MSAIISEQEKQRIASLSQQLYVIIKDISILRHLRWPAQVKAQFFRAKESALPVVEYPAYDAKPVLQQLHSLRRQLRDSQFDDWVAKHIQTMELTVSMLQACGTAEFGKFSAELYGKPTDELLDGSSTALALAQRFNTLLCGFKPLPQIERSQPMRTAKVAARKIAAASDSMFGGDSPEVFVVDELSANALASVDRIRLRRKAKFSEQDILQLIQHEAYIHVATALNGRNQSALPSLGCSHAGTTRTQEGLAVFAEFITGTMDLDRMRRLADRMLAIQMALEGADFIDVYRYFLEQTEGDSEQSFENARRVFRGGVLTGGAPFTKDIVYLDGLIRVHNFLRSAVAANRADCIPLLFCGKLDLDDIPVIGLLSQAGLCESPKYLPPWVNDMRFLLTYLAYSSFLNSVDLDPIKDHYEEVLSHVPKTLHF